MEKLELHQTFHEYCEEKLRFNIHQDITNILNTGNKADRLTKHMLYYGAKGIGKYSQALLNIQGFSPTKLKYERKLIVSYDKTDYLVMMSDIHFEIDMELLGCNSKSLFLAMIRHIEDIVETRSERVGIVLCKNFHLIHNELLDVFYSYMSRMSHISKIVFHIISEHVAFIPDNIVASCHIVQMSRPTKAAIAKIKTNGILAKRSIMPTQNLSTLKTDLPNIVTIETKIEESIVGYMSTNMDEFSLSKFRELIYDMLVYNIDVHECIGNIVFRFMKTGRIKKEQYHNVFIYMYQTLKQYNNNYRPIYHLENIYYYLITIIHEEKFSVS